MRYGSVCSGIEAASVAWQPLGWTPAWFAEIEPFPSAVLAHHYPDVPNLGDMTTLARAALLGQVEAPDVLVGGTPCQAFSVAGLREGLDDERGQLVISFVRLANAIDHVRHVPGSHPPSSSGKTSPACSVVETTPSAAFLARSLGKTVSCSQQGRDGRTLVVCMDPKGQSRGGFLMPNISAWPNDAAVCSLWQVLETGSIPPRYFLSPTACAGILRRAEARRKTLPTQLRVALENVVATAPTTSLLPPIAGAMPAAAA